MNHSYENWNSKDKQVTAVPILSLDGMEEGSKCLFVLHYMQIGLYVVW